MGHFTEAFVVVAAVFMFVYLFILIGRERERAGRGRRRGRDRISSRLHAVSTEPDAGLNLMNHEIMT